MRMADRSHLRLHVGCPSSPQLPEEENSPHANSAAGRSAATASRTPSTPKTMVVVVDDVCPSTSAAHCQIHASTARLQSRVEIFRKLGDLSVGGVESERLRGYCAALVGVREDTQSVAAASARARHQWRLTGYVIS